MVRIKALAGAGAVGLAALGMAGCQSTIDQNSANKAVVGHFNRMGEPAKSASCPDSQDAKVGTTFHCDVTLENGTKTGATVNVTQVSNNTVYFQITPDGSSAGGSSSSTSGPSGSSSSAGASGASSSTSGAGSSTSGSSGASSSASGSSGSST